MGLWATIKSTYKKPWLEHCCRVMQNAAFMHIMMSFCCIVALKPWSCCSDDTMRLKSVSEKSLKVAGTIHLPCAAEGGGTQGEEGGVGLYLTAQQPPCWVFRSAALWGVFGFVLVVVGLVVFDYVVLATEKRDHTWQERPWELWLQSEH